MRGIDHADATRWKNLLETDERIVWVGRPSQKLQFRVSSAYTVYCLFLIGLGCIGLFRPTEMMEGFWPVFLLLIASGMYGFVGRAAWQAFVRSQTRYALTTKRVFISERAFGRNTIKSCPITVQTLIQARAESGSIEFGVKFGHTLDGAWPVPVGFYGVDDLQHLLRLMDQVQRGVA